MSSPLALRAWQAFLGDHLTSLSASRVRSLVGWASSIRRSRLFRLDGLAPHSIPPERLFPDCDKATCTRSALDGCSRFDACGASGGSFFPNALRHQRTTSAKGPSAAIPRVRMSCR
jgi:hypothetical protein